SLRRAEVINRRPHPFEEQPDAPQVKTRSVFRLCKVGDSCCHKDRCGFRFWVTEARGAFTGGRSKVAAERPIKLGELPVYFGERPTEHLPVRFGAGAGHLLDDPAARKPQRFKALPQLQRRRREVIPAVITPAAFRLLHLIFNCLTFPASGHGSRPFVQESSMQQATRVTENLLAPAQQTRRRLPA